MKYIKYILLAVVCSLVFIECKKHELDLTDPSIGVEGLTEFQILYEEPVAVSPANAIDSVFVNGKLYNNLTINRLVVKGIIPYPNTYYTAPIGNVNIQFYRGKDAEGKGVVVYNKDVTLPKGKHQVIVYDMSKDPLVLDDEYPYPAHPVATPETFDTDSLVSFRFINLLYDKPGKPYEGKLQYQWSNNATNYTNGDWNNLGQPVAFGEQTTREFCIVHKTVYNSQGSQTLRFRCVDPTTGEMVTGTIGGKTVNTGDYWTAYIGRANTHVLIHCLNDNPKLQYHQIINNVW